MAQLFGGAYGLMMVALIPVAVERCRGMFGILSFIIFWPVSIFILIFVVIMDDIENHNYSKWKARMRARRNG